MGHDHSTAWVNSSVNIRSLYRLLLSFSSVLSPLLGFRVLSIRYSRTFVLLARCAFCEYVEDLALEWADVLSGVGGH